MLCARTAYEGLLLFGSRLCSPRTVLPGFAGATHLAAATRTMASVSEDFFFRQVSQSEGR
jgi:hypothetical protein